MATDGAHPEIVSSKSLRCSYLRMVSVMVSAVHMSSWNLLTFQFMTISVFLLHVLIDRRLHRILILHFIIQMFVFLSWYVSPGARSCLYFYLQSIGILLVCCHQVLSRPSSSIILCSSWGRFLVIIAGDYGINSLSIFNHLGTKFSLRKRFSSVGSTVVACIQFSIFTLGSMLLITSLWSLPMSKRLKTVICHRISLFTHQDLPRAIYFLLNSGIRCSCSLDSWRFSSVILSNLGVLLYGLSIRIVAPLAFSG